MQLEKVNQALLISQFLRNLNHLFDGLYRAFSLVYIRYRAPHKTRHPNSALKESQLD